MKCYHCDVELRKDARCGNPFCRAYASRADTELIREARLYPNRSKPPTDASVRAMTHNVVNAQARRVAKPRKDTT